MLLSDSTVQAFKVFFDSPSFDERDLLRITENYEIETKKPFKLKKKSSISRFFGVQLFTLKYFYIREAIAADSPQSNEILRLNALRAFLTYWHCASNASEGLRTVFDIVPHMLQKIASSTDKLECEKIRHFYKLYLVDPFFTFKNLEESVSSPIDPYMHSLDIELTSISSGPDWSNFDEE